MCILIFFWITFIQYLHIIQDISFRFLCWISFIAQFKLFVLIKIYWLILLFFNHKLRTNILFLLLRTISKYLIVFIIFFFNYMLSNIIRSIVVLFFLFNSFWLLGIFFFYQHLFIIRFIYSILSFIYERGFRHLLKWVVIKLTSSLVFY